MEKIAVIEKIKKLLAVTASTNENEAANAANLARKLMLKHGVEMNEVNSDVGVEIVQQDLGCFARPMPWRTDLYIATAKFYGAGILQDHDRLIMVGTRETIQVTVEMLNYLDKTMTRNYTSAHKLDPVIEALSYRFGWVKALREKMESITSKDADDLSSSENALMVLNDNAVQKWFEDNNIRKGGKYTVTYHGRSYAAGKTDGAKVSLNAQIK